MAGIECATEKVGAMFGEDEFISWETVGCVGILFQVQWECIQGFQEGVA